MIHAPFDFELGTISLDGISDGLESLKREIRLFQNRVSGLQEAYGRYVGLCPVHAENTPSFNVTSQNGTLLFKCFGCGISGSIIDLEMALTGCTLETAIRRLKLEAAGLTHLVEPLPKERPKAVFRATFLDVEEAHANLEAALAEGYPLLTSFIDGSGLRPVVKSLRLGFAQHYFFGCGCPDCPGCGPRPALVVPLFYRGELLGIRFRSLNKNDVRHKWVSMPGSKQDFLWLVDTPLPGAASTAFVFEGIRDAALARALGFNGVGTLSATAVPERNPTRRFLESVSILKSAYKPIILVGDSDAPGRAAKERLACILDSPATLVETPTDKDLTEFYQQVDEESVRAWLWGLAMTGSMFEGPAYENTEQFPEGQ